jgi:hypothetical protein
VPESPACNDIQHEPRNAAHTITEVISRSDRKVALHWRIATHHGAGDSVNASRRYPYQARPYCCTQKIAATIASHSIQRRCNTDKHVNRRAKTAALQQ